MVYLCGPEISLFKVNQKKLQILNAAERQHYLSLMLNFHREKQISVWLTSNKALVHSCEALVINENDLPDMASITDFLLRGKKKS